MPHHADFDRLAVFEWRSIDLHSIEFDGIPASRHLPQPDHLPVKFACL